MIEKWKHGLDTSEKFGTMFMDLSKAFETLNHNLLFDKLNGYSFSFGAIKFFQRYLLERSQTEKANNKRCLHGSRNPHKNGF